MLIWDVRGVLTPLETPAIYRLAKQQIVQEIMEVMAMVGIQKVTLARKMGVMASGVSQLLDVDKGMQLKTLVRIADVLDCDVEVNFIRRGPYSES